ncbi:nucleotidyltransferase domain-containing protein [Candidatus Bathyarchaeota archaeon]|nr:nucleotidyltransferase domain-containing protein [Candidatus Bathyarchaeota archaeon]
MMRLPEKIRRVLEKIVKELASKEDVHGIGLFGSWGRGDATTASDVDLLILTKSDTTDEYVERMLADGIMVDFNFIPIKWVFGPLPPELDQKLFEAQILYDRDWKLTNVKMLIARAYSSPERVEIRTNAHAIEADIHLSRATSALSKGDFLSAHLFARTAMENALKIPLEIALQPISNSRFIEKAGIAAEKLGLKEMFTDYVEIAGLDALNKTQIEEKLKRFKALWDEMHFTVKQHAQTVEKVHFKLKTSLKYYFNPFFMQGAVLRTTSIINAGNFAEAAHYLDSIFISMLENYAWLKSTIEKQHINHTTLIRSIENLEKTNPKMYHNTISLLGIADAHKTLANKTVEKARKNITRLHKEKKHLIKTHISKN